MSANRFRRLGLVLVAAGLALSGQGRADAPADGLIALAEPVVAAGVDGGVTGFDTVYVVTAPINRPRHYAADLPKAVVAVCGRVDLAKASPGRPLERRFFATFPVQKGPEHDNEVTFTVEDNDPADLSPASMERSARFLRGWRQYCLDASHRG